MRYIVLALILMMALSSGALAQNCPNCPDAWQGNQINQTNEQVAIAGSTPLIPGYIYIDGCVQEKAANWAVAAGDGNYLYQDNIQHGESSWLTAGAEGKNLALMVGSGNEAHQLNYAPNFIIKPLPLPASLDTITISQMNEVIILGEDNYADQSNREKSDLTTLAGSIELDQKNFGLIFGENNTLAQNNTDRASLTGWFGYMDKTQANAAYLYGYRNLVDQSNRDYASIETELLLSLPSIDQIAKNLAFAISSCCSPEFMPLCNNTSLSEECPTVTIVPPTAPEYPLSEYPLDP